MSSTAHTMGERVKSLRTTKRINQDVLARRMGCKKSTLSLLERGHTKQLNAEHTKACADVLGTTVGYLLYGDPAPSGRMAHEEKTRAELPPDALQVAHDYLACAPAIRTAGRELLKLGAGRI